MEAGPKPGLHLNWILSPESRGIATWKALLDCDIAMATTGVFHPCTLHGTSGEAGSVVQICNAERVFLDKVPPRFNLVAHEFGKQVFGIHAVGDPDLQ